MQVCGADDVVSRRRIFLKSFDFETRGREVCEIAKQVRGALGDEAVGINAFKSSGFGHKADLVIGGSLDESEGIIAKQG